MSHLTSKCVLFMILFQKATPTFPSDPWVKRGPISDTIVPKELKGGMKSLEDTGDVLVG